MLYVAAPLRPTEEEIRAHPSWRTSPTPVDASYDEIASAVLGWNLRRALRWLAWLRKSFPETTFIAPWISAVMSSADDTDPGQREAGIVDACAVIERCDGIVLCGGRISEGMRREVEHGIRAHSAAESYTNNFDVYDITTLITINGEPPTGLACGRGDSRPISLSEWWPR